MKKIIFQSVAVILLTLILIGDAVLFIGNGLASLVQHFSKSFLAFFRVTLTLTRKRVTATHHTIFVNGQKHSASVRTKTARQTTRIPRMITRAVSALGHLRIPQPAFPSLWRRHRLVTRRVGRPKLLPPPSPFSFFAKFKYFIAGGIFSLLFVFLPLLVIILLQDLPNPNTLTLGQIPQTTKIYDRNGTLLYQIFASQNRTLVTLDQIPLHLRQATIAIEDKDYYKHLGFDVTAIIRSFIENTSGGRTFQGGSTITQQLIKSALLTSETSYTRKIKEVILAFWAERIYTKNQILQLYFNLIPYGGTAWGIEAASQTYFGKSVTDLNVAESAFLAGIPQAPTQYSPYGTNPTAWKKRQKDVLKRMVDLGYISSEQAQQAEAEELEFQPPQTPIRAPHFVMYVKDYLVKKYGLPLVEKGGLNVVTSLDLKRQDIAQQIVRDQINADSYLNLTNGAALVVNPQNGDIIAMVGSRDFNEPQDGNVNVTTSRRQPGSSIKIVTYTAALSNGFTAATLLDDSPVAYTNPGAPTYAPVNYDGKFHGRVPLRAAFGNSFNITAVRTLNQIGIPTFVNMGKRMGIRSWGQPDQYGLSITLGAAEVTMVDMATIFGTIANGGERVDINPLVRVTDYTGNVIEQKPDSIQKQRVVDEGVAYIVTDILADNSARTAAFGPNSLLVIPGRHVSVKTGTTDNKRDNWTIGFTPSLLTAVWVGNNDNSPMNPALASGVTGAAPIWNKIMRTLLKDMPEERRPIPANVVSRSCQGRIEYFVRGTENSVSCNPLPTFNPFTPTPRERR